MASIEQLLGTVSGFLWGWPLIVLLLGTHVFLTLRLGFPQRHLLKAIRISLRREQEGAGDVSQFGALTTALAATIGTGNIVGVSTAIAAGGPGAVLWMWLTGVFGIATKYSEALLSVKYRVTDADGTMSGGPMYVLERGLKMKWLGVLFAAFTAVAAFGIGNTVQANSIAVLAEETFGISPWVSGGVLTALTAVVILGGIKSIARVCELLVPFMAGFYVLGCLYLLALHSETLPDAFRLIVSSAFTGQAAFGGFLAARGDHSPWPAFLAVWGGNVAGALFMYWLGRRLGRQWIDRQFHLGAAGQNEARLAAWHARYGPFALFVSRFLPAVRALVPPMAGALHFPLLELTLAISLASATWYGAITWLAFTTGNNWEALVARVSALGMWSGVIAVALVTVALAIWWRRRRRAS
jgi:membrane protein DedA with SNARE-associated domain